MACRCKTGFLKSGFTFDTLILHNFGLNKFTHLSTPVTKYGGWRSSSQTHLTNQQQSAVNDRNTTNETLETLV